MASWTITMAIPNEDCRVCLRQRIIHESGFISELVAEALVRERV